MVRSSHPFSLGEQGHLVRRGLRHGFFALLLAAMTGAPALANFSGRTFISPASHIPLLPSAAVDADGDVLYVWDDTFVTGRIAVRARSASGDLGGVKFVSPAGESAIAPQVAVAPGGKAAIAWLVNDGSSWRIRGRTRSPAGVLGPIETFVTGPELTDLSVTMDGDGDAFVLWRNDDHLIQMRVLSKSGSLGPLEEIATHPTDTFTLPRLAVAPDGRSQIAWLRDVGGDHRIEARTRDVDGTLRAIKTVTGPDPEPIAYSLATNAQNSARFVWMESGFTIRARIRPPTGALGAKRLIGAGDSTQLVDITADPDGNAIIMWSATDGINVRPLSATGATGMVRQLTAGDNAMAIDLRTLKNGTTVFLWMTVEPNEVRVFARLRQTNGTFAPRQPLSPIIPHTTFPFLATGPEGEVIAGWTRTANSTSRVETIFGP